MNSFIGSIFLKSCSTSLITKISGYFKSIDILISLSKIILTKFDFLLFFLSPFLISHFAILKLIKNEKAFPTDNSLLQSKIN